LDLNLLSSFLYDPSLGNLLMTVVSFDFAQQPNPLFLDADVNAGTIFSRRFSAGGGNSNIGLVTGFNDPAPTPLPAALPLFTSGLGALGLLGWRKRRKAATAA
jgi:PEP-CTERM motif